MKEDKKKVFIRTFGCQMNVRDSEVVCGVLTQAGFHITDEPAQADIVILNTCSVRQHAEEKVWSEVGRFKRKGQSPSGTVPMNKILGIIGCMAQSHKEKIFERAPQVDFVVGPSDIHKIPSIIEKFLSGPHKGESPCGDSPLFKTKIWETEGKTRPDVIYHTGFYQEKVHAYVVISEGCSNFCSYCVVPYARGALRNRESKAIIKEIEEAMERGITKITLLGQNVNAYSQSAEDAQSPVRFTDLLIKVNEISGLKEFSFITSHPKDTSRELFKVMGSLEKLKKYLHLPIQSGSNRILKLMNRGYEREFYLDLSRNYRTMVKNGVLTTDIIIGFPTETLEDFQDTYNLVKEVVFDAAFIFKYSPRPYTSASTMEDTVERKEKERRHAQMLKLQKTISKGKVKG
ncbi:MAG: tRNA (N6-isopentenyl adenosine(37)-C2)-methylthiotransferase MiaB [Candidatus Omnitrophica bacterium]|nr:tRNA (N6-isopentenyl adenosine(37)-C2)-methylthiotransferase MiaB [Candidatus Omnitrophota bacterium]